LALGAGYAREEVVLRIGIDGRYIEDHFPGIGRYTYNLINRIPEIAREADFLVLHDPRLLNTRYDVESLARHPNLQLVAVDIPTLSLKEQYRLRSLARGLSLDLLHSPYYIKPYWLPCPSVVTIFDLIPMIYPQSLPHRWLTWVFRGSAALAIRRAERVITISESAKGDLVRLFRASPDEIAVSYLAADKRFRPAPEEEVDRVRQKHGLPKRYMLYLGINKPHKNLVFLLRMFSELKTEVTLVLAGKEDPRYPQAREEAKRLDLGDSVVFLGEVADGDLPMLYNGAELFVFPSLYEGFGLPVLEAMACGAPVVCSNTSSLPEIVGDAAITLDPLDREVWVTALTEVLAKEDLRAELRAKGLKQAARFSWEKAAKETLAVYSSLVKD
jgi:glycosyltransferase involved in cell wall biosynthesis